MASIFTRIVSGELPSYKVAENDKFLAFLDVRPLAKGHTLVIPKQEIDYVFEMADEELAEIIVFAKKVALAIEKVVPCTKIGLSIIGLEVPHAHLHLVPIFNVSDMTFGKPAMIIDPEEMKTLATEIAAKVIL